MTLDILLSQTNKSRSKGCFIATAVYGSQNSRELKLLKYFRDSYLLKNYVGKIIVMIYYRISPPLALKIEKSKFYKKIVRSMILKPLLVLLNLIINKKFN